MISKFEKINPHEASKLKQIVFCALYELEAKGKKRSTIKEIVDFIINELEINTSRQAVEYALRSDKKATNKNSAGYKLMESGRSQIKRVKKKDNNLSATKLGGFIYINSQRIGELNSTQNEKFDLSKLIQFCEELNFAFSGKSYLSTIMLVRAIIDHVPPIFNKKNFTEVANNYGDRSFSDSMKRLNESSRKIADSYLHRQIRRTEVLPNHNQVDFSNDLDVLLAEIYRILKSN